MARVTAGTSAGEAAVTVIASQGPLRGRGSATIDIVAVTAPRRPEAGIPQPEQIDEPQQTWRSRMVDARWEVNVGHPDYRELVTQPASRLRYLAWLLAKEIVSRNFPQPGAGQTLEEMVGLLAALERSGAWRRGPR
jgi:hypothetical protein